MDNISLNLVAPNYCSKADTVASFETLQNNDDVDRNLEADLCLTLFKIGLSLRVIRIFQILQLR